jgi:hypothetical protein
MNANILASEEFLVIIKNISNIISYYVMILK